MPVQKSIPLFLLGALALAACGPGGRGGPDGGRTGGGGGGGGGGGDGGDGCSDSSKDVYVVDVSNTFSKFDPTTKTFTDLGTLSCEDPLFGGTPFSMGVDRDTNAWVVYSDGALYKVDVLNGLTCTLTAWGSPDNLDEFGMGFSTDTAGGSTDSLFVSGGPDLESGTPPATTTLAKVDLGTFNATTVGTVDGSPELTGTGSAELWGWFPDASAPRIEKLNKTNGTALTTFQSTLSSLAGTPMDWAFAFYGGDFWVFLERDSDSATKVYQIDGADGSIKSTTDTQTRSIVGAGVSTCAPIVIQ